MTDFSIIEADCATLGITDRAKVLQLFEALRSEPRRDSPQGEVSSVPSHGLFPWQL